MVRDQLVPAQLRGSTPPFVAGRHAEILAFGDAVDQGLGAPGRATIYTGLHGIGKTVMLAEAEGKARQHGLVVVSKTAVPGLVQRLVTRRLPAIAANLEMGRQGTKLTAISLTSHLGGVIWQPPASSERPDLRAQLTALTDHFSQHGTGRLLTIDELHQSDRPGMREWWRHCSTACAKNDRSTSPARDFRQRWPTCSTTTS